MVKQHIATILKNSLHKIGVSNKEIQLDTPANQSFGDYTSNIAMQLSKELKKSPFDIANEIAHHIHSDEIIEKVDVLKPGFLNFWLQKEYLLKNIGNIVDKEQKYGLSEQYKDKKIIIEYTDPNPFKEFHIGHLYSNIVGESLVRLHRALGAEVMPVCYQGDVGLHVAKSIFGMIKKMAEENIDLKAFDSKYPETKDKARFMGEAYALGSTTYEENEETKKQITELNKKIYEQNDEIKDLYEHGKQWSLDYFKTLYDRLGTTFTHHFFESEVGPQGLQLVRDNVQKGIFKESNGAIVFEGEEHGLHTRVFINSHGLPTYEAKDLGLAPTKYEWYPYDLSIIVTGNEVDSYFKVVLKALELINPELAGKTKHISHGMVRLPEGKMSSRTGKVVTAEWLLDTAKEKAMNIIQKTSQQDKVHVDPVNQNETAEKVAIAAIKYALLKNNIGHDVEFSFDESVSFEGNSGPYLQYTFVRAKSILAKSDNLNETLIPPESISIEELELLRFLEKYSHVVEVAGKSLAPNLITNYLFNLAQKFNLFYQKIPILKTEDNNTRNFRLRLTQSVAQIISNGLHLLGIETVEKM